MIAAVRGPYCTGPSAPAGTADLVRCPQRHSRSISWCSVTVTATSGRSKTWRRSTPVTGRPASPAPHRPHQRGSWRTSRSGRATCASVVPSCPSCPPGLRPLFFRSDRGRGGGLSSPSLDGGFEEFRGVCLSRASSSAIRSRACISSLSARASAACDSASSARSEATTAASTSSREPASSPGTARTLLPPRTAYPAIPHHRSARPLSRASLPYPVPLLLPVPDRAKYPLTWIDQYSEARTHGHLGDYAPSFSTHRSGGFSGTETIRSGDVPSASHDERWRR